MTYIIKAIEWSDAVTNEVGEEFEIECASYDDIEDVVDEQIPDLMAYEII